MKILDAAHYLVYLSYQSNHRSLTPLKLQKLLYFAQGWSYVWDDRPLFDEEFLAWQYGPVNAEVYRQFKKYGREPIPATEGYPSAGSASERETLSAIWNRYGGHSASSLVLLTHEQWPWQRAYLGSGVISNQDICNYFKSTY